MTQVVAALIRRGNRFLICRRPAHKTRGLLWEFVGGKVEPGETKQQALARECMEELAVEIAVGPVYMQVVHPYPDMTVELTLFDAAITAGEPQLLEHCEIAWITPQEIDNFDFCPADVEILAKLKADAAISPR
ncbi:MAG: (deoxy)nucleoside triphosphate pyrophosphohydrolase [Clostridia bacterium]|nr:(deoxy)nucleoside triphosphate pyrophosphohydrolase [Clostridia bacterium]